LSSNFDPTLLIGFQTAVEIVPRSVTTYSVILTTSYRLKQTETEGKSHSFDAGKTSHKKRCSF